MFIHEQENHEKSRKIKIIQATNVEYYLDTGIKITRTVEVFLFSIKKTPLSATSSFTTNLPWHGRATASARGNQTL